MQEQQQPPIPVYLSCCKMRANRYIRIVDESKTCKELGNSRETKKKFGSYRVLIGTETKGHWAWLGLGLLATGLPMPPVSHK